MPTKAAVSTMKAMTMRIIITVTAVFKDPCSKFWDPDPGVVANEVVIRPGSLVEVTIKMLSIVDAIKPIDVTGVCTLAEFST